MDLQNTAASIPVKHEPVGNPQIILTSVRLMTTRVPRWVRQNSTDLFVLQHKSMLKLNLNEMFQFVKWLPHQWSCDTRSYLQRLGICQLCISTFGLLVNLGKFVIRVKLPSGTSKTTLIPTWWARRPALKGPIKILGPYKDDIGRSQTYLMLFYRLKCYLAQKDYCHSASRN